MASSSSIVLLAMAALAALLAVGSCGTAVTWTVGKGSSSTKLVLEANAPVSEVSIKESGATDFTDDLKEGPAKTVTYESKEEIKGPLCVRFAVEGAGYRTSDDIIPTPLKPGSTYNTKIQV